MNEKKYCKVCGNKISEFEYDFNNCMCYKCSRNEWNDKLAERLKENEEIETSFEDEIVCPYCGYRMADDDGYFEREGDGEYDCEECGKTFNFAVNIEVTYSTTRKEDEE